MTAANPEQDRPTDAHDEPGDWFTDVPKVELHLHLEGAIPHPAMWRLLCKYGGDTDVPTLAALEQRFQYTDFGHFLEMWMWKNRFLRELDDFEFMAEAVARSLAAENIVYVEAFYSPPDFADTGLSIGELTSAVRRGLDRVADIEIRLVADLVRNYGAERGARTLAEVAEVKDECGVIGIGIGGAEAPFPPELFASVFERARELGFSTSAHAGEGAGAASVWGAIRSLRVDRIGHGTRAIEDAALLDHLAATRIPIEMCPISNVRTQVVDSLKAHPIRAFMERGLLVTVNTDDPAMFQTSLAHEYRELCRVHGLDRADILALIDNAVASSWLDESGKEELRQRLKRARA